MDKTYTYICDKCQSEVTTSEEAIIKCQVCGNKIDTRPDVWNTKQDVNSSTKVNKIWFVIFIVLISFAAFKIWVRKNQTEMEKHYSKMRNLLTSPYIDEEYQINYPVRLEKNSAISPVFKKNEAVSDFVIQEGNTQNLTISVISYKSSNEAYSNVKLSRDTIIKNYVAILFSEETKSEDFKIIDNRFHSLYTQGILSMDKKHFGLRILSDFDSKTGKNWHLIVIYDINKENEIAADELINSRHLGSELDHIE
jgi:DNA-directed RNA polymerase subunit RPC12/RpoP/flagellar basal body-associated protein FliL